MSAIDVLKQWFGYDSFREGQAEMIHSILGGKDVLGIMPTGAGKSLCYQIPALMLSGMALIVSPLISLMRDQVMALKTAGVPAAFINSSLSDVQCAMTMSNAKNGKYKLIYVAPERLLLPAMIDLAQSSEISLIAVDEAHCVSQWGHDFRPSYLDISKFVGRLSKRPVIAAFTATATSRVREDIVDLIQLREPDRLVTSFDRANLFFDVKTPADKYGELIRYLKSHNGNGIVYCSTRKQVERVAEKLKEDGYHAARYHAGLDDEERSRSQDDFLYDRVRIIVATNAFGMGIDKSNVRFVIHYNMPKNVENYYQEAGRAGRDGLPADCILYYARNDLVTAIRLINTSTNNEEIKKNRQLLDYMERYCESDECLRNYILRYFGQDAFDECGYCGHCSGSKHQKDITLDAQKVLSHITRLNRAGNHLLFTHMANILLGRSENFRDLLSFALMKGSTRHYIKAVVNRLVVLGYLAEGRYMTVTERAKDVLFGGVHVTMQGKQTNAPSASCPVRQNDESSRYQFSDEIFLKLKQLRLDIAKDERVPAFVVFSDATLVDMCQKHPKTIAEMLDVSGVGKVKMEKYGERFLNLLRSEQAVKFAGIREQAFSYSVLRDKVEISENLLQISQVADTINAALIRYGKKTINGKKLNDMLEEAGYLISVEGRKKPSHKGREVGIMTIERASDKDSGTQNWFGTQAQKLCVELLIKARGTRQD